MSRATLRTDKAAPLGCGATSMRFREGHDLGFLR
jgi:hypothetical protein